MCTPKGVPVLTGETKTRKRTDHSCVMTAWVPGSKPLSSYPECERGKWAAEESGRRGRRECGSVLRRPWAFCGIRMSPFSPFLLFFSRDPPFPLLTVAVVEGPAVTVGSICFCAQAFVRPRPSSFLSSPRRQLLPPSSSPVLRSAEVGWGRLTNDEREKKNT